jgi:hypothetical protein
MLEHDYKKVPEKIKMSSPIESFKSYPSGWEAGLKW